MILISPQFNIETFFAQFLTVSDVLKAGYLIFKDAEVVWIIIQLKAPSQFPEDQSSLISSANRIGDRCSDPSTGRSISIMVDYQGPFLSGTIRVGKDILVDISFRSEEIVKQKMFDVCKEMTALHQREDFSFMSSHQILIRLFVPFGIPVFHPVFFGKSFNLAMSEHREPGQGYHHRADTKIFILLAELRHSGFLVRIAHKIDKTLEDLRIKFERIFHYGPVLCILFILQHIHEGAVIDPVHSERPDKVPF